MVLTLISSKISARDIEKSAVFGIKVMAGSGRNEFETFGLGHIFQFLVHSGVLNGTVVEDLLKQMPTETLKYLFVEVILTFKKGQWNTIHRRYHSMFDEMIKRIRQSKKLFGKVMYLFIIACIKITQSKIIVLPCLDLRMLSAKGETYPGHFRNCAICSQLIDKFAQTFQTINNKSKQSNNKKLKKRRNTGIKISTTKNIDIIDGKFEYFENDDVGKYPCKYFEMILKCFIVDSLRYEALEKIKDPLDELAGQMAHVYVSLSSDEYESGHIGIKDLVNRENIIDRAHKFLHNVDKAKTCLDKKFNGFYRILISHQRVTLTQQQIEKSGRRSLLTDEEAKLAQKILQGNKDKAPTLEGSWNSTRLNFKNDKV